MSISAMEGEMRFGTANFVSFIKACDYYREYGFTIEEVQRKLRKGEIRIGTPSLVLQPGERLVTIDNDTRYAIETEE